MARQRIELALEEAEELSRRTRATTVSVRDRRRAEIVLLSAQGLTQQRIAEQLGISRLAVNRWVGRFSLHRLDGLNDRTGRGRKPWLPQAAVQQVLEQAVTPPPHLGRWSCRTMARAARVSPASVQRLWAASDIKPHLSRTFKLSNDKRFEEKFWDVIGLYLNPPDKALVLCCDEKSQCQALERTQPGLPLGIGHIRRFVARISSRAKSAPRMHFHERRTYSGRPSSSMWFSEATAMATSVVCRPSVRERSASPITRL